MKEPNYVLKFNEMHLAPKDNYTLLKVLKTAVIVIWIALAFSAIIFGGGLFGGVSSTAIVILLVVSGKLLFTSKLHRIKRIIEIKFFDDYLLVFRPETIISPSKRRIEYFTFKYKDIEKCHYRKGAKRITFYGHVDCKYYYYKDDGSIPDKPDHHTTPDTGMCYFYVDAEPDIDFVAEIENHSPIKVVITDN